MPKMQPKARPKTFDVVFVHRTSWLSSCSSVSFGSLIPAFFAKLSIQSPVKRPTQSESVLPNPAAHMVETPSLTPIDASIASPAKIMMTLSMKPNPTNGMEDTTASLLSCPLLGGTYVSSA
eukprot:CAMPEP_0197690084 /NCGR_PEP_ID=MMETSP1338-20131121/107842_1 /TAXON_ID=43686 ORGANISM="Pelagodinium beii, Strain RCC1491" /NCGR_SAMPLE_ID=MMETSP1338 /ASSEMBLY_ACC=CAM_ASM_000754 /LENGTH=120 /DNA_ID=CAMNT_0043272491 /DNA_START=295 /DNA_END=657 /DNA_ORIENTATION=-